MNNKEKVELWLLRIKQEPERWTVRQAMDDIYPEQYTMPNTMYVGDKQFGTSGVSGNHPVGAVGTIGTGIGGAGGNGKNRGGAY
jgi:hypothetical protein